MGVRSLERDSECEQGINARLATSVSRHDYNRDGNATTSIKSLERRSTC